MNVSGNPRPRRTRWVLVFFGVIAPLCELASVILVGQQLGAGVAFLLLLAGVVVGGLILSAQGRKARSSLQQRLAAARSGDLDQGPRGGSGTGWLVLSGVLFMAPGFFSDVIAVLLVVPPVRRGLNVALAALGLRWFRKLEDQVVPPGSPLRYGDVVTGDVVPEPAAEREVKDPGVIEGRIVED